MNPPPLRGSIALLGAGLSAIRGNCCSSLGSGVLREGMGFKSLMEIDRDLPNGFHDALLESITVSYCSNSVELDLKLLVGDPDANTEEGREARRAAKLILNDVVYFVIDPPTPGRKHSSVGGLRIDAGDATLDSSPESPKPRGVLPTDAFAYWFFVDTWNSFIHIAAREA